MWPNFRYNDSAELQEKARLLLRMLEPFSVVGKNKIRLGGVNDGGYVLLDDFSSMRTAYSLGINDDVAWDLEMADRGLNIFQYDHTIHGLPVQHPNFNWFQTGIGAVQDDAARLDTLEALITRNGHSDDLDMLLKMDIEGAEWEVLSTIEPLTLRRFKQITIEVHGLQHIDEPEWCERVLEAISRLTAEHSVIHVHANNNGPYCIVGGMPMAATLELTLVRRSDYDLVPSQEVFPTELDAPCFPHRADYALGTFRF